MRLFMLFAVLALSSCGIPNTVKEANFYNAEAAKHIALVSADSGVKEEAGNIVAGSALIARKIGDPEVTPAPYTPKQHAATNDAGNKDVDAQESVKKGISGFFTNLVTKGADLLIPGAGGFLVAAFFWVKKALNFNKLKAGLIPIVDTVERHPEIKAKIAEYAGKIGAGDVVKAAVDLAQK